MARAQICTRPIYLLCSSPCADTNVPNLMNGLFILFCLGCERCLGFFILDKPEGVRGVFDMIYTRFRVCPLYIIYDRACLLGQSIYIREPAYVQFANFCVDCWHIFGHINCGTMCHHKHHTVPLTGLNTQLMEQTKSGCVAPLRARASG